MTKVTIQDDSLRANKVIMITPATRLEFARMGKIIPRGYTFLPAIDQKTRKKVQDAAVVERTYEDEHLERTIKRARRWIRSRRFVDRVPAPRHIMHALTVFNKHDRKAFAEAVTDARS